MAKKTKMILHKDHAKERVSHCDGCGKEMEFDPVDPKPITEDMMDFIKTQEHWSEHHAPSIAWGMLTAVFVVIFDIAPNKDRAVELITDCMAEFVERADA